MDGGQSCIHDRDKRFAYRMHKVAAIILFKVVK